MFGWIPSRRRRWKKPSRQEPVAREPVWFLELNEYQRDNLLKALQTEVTYTGDWHGEIRHMLEQPPRYERVYHAS